MKKKLAKVLSVMVAVVISVSAMAVNASAATWSVYRKHSSSKPGAPIETEKLQKFQYHTATSITSYNTGCTSYSSDTNTDGKPAYATTVAVYVKPNESTPHLVADPYSYYRVTASTSRELKETIQYGWDFYVEYHLYNSNTILSNISGNVSVPNGTLIKSYYGN